LVYHKNIQFKYDELVGVKKLSTVGHWGEWA
jgi:hypothetical protein